MNTYQRKRLLAGHHWSRWNSSGIPNMHARLKKFTKLHVSTVICNNTGVNAGINIVSLNGGAEATFNLSAISSWDNKRTIITIWWLLNGLHHCTWMPIIGDTEWKQVALLNVPEQGCIMNVLIENVAVNFLPLTCMDSDCTPSQQGTAVTTDNRYRHWHS